MKRRKKYKNNDHKIRGMQPGKIIVAVTGHRPNKLWGYDYFHPCYLKLQQVFIDRLKKDGCTDAWTGMALGVDMVFAHAVLQFKYEGYPIKLHCAIPCIDHPSAWPAESIKHYNEILSLADEVVLVTNAPYAPRLMQRRNEYMVNRADRIYAVWNGDRTGGTYNCYKYAESRRKSIVRITPNEIEELLGV